MEQIPDTQLFEELDLSMDSLRPVADAHRAGDPRTAVTQLARYYRSRTEPAPPPLNAPPDRRGHDLETSSIIEKADRIVDHIFEFVGHPPQQLGPEIAWNEDPVDYDQWPIAFNRHNHWVTLARAYRAAGDEKYAREFVAQLRSWIRAMPVEIGDRWVQAGWATEGRMSLSLDAGIRMGQTWVHAYYAFLDSPSVTDDDLIAMVKAFRDHAVYLMDPVHFRIFSNWGIMEANGLYHIGAYFPEFDAAETWRETAMNRLRDNFDRQVYPDGAQIELASGYHHVSLRNFVLAYQTALRTGRKVPADYLAGLERMYHYSLYVAFPDLRMPAVNDSGPHDIRKAMIEAHEYFPGRKDFEWAAAGGDSVAPPAPASTAFPYAGHFLLRSGWDPDDPALFFDGGPYGIGHQHEDKLNLILYAHGRILIQDPGNFQYDTSKWRRYMLSSWSHNTVVVDGHGQHRAGAAQPREEYIVDEPLPHVWITDPGFDYVSAAYDDGYGSKKDRTVSHRRSILYIKPDIWIVTDILTPSDETEHQYEAAFIFDADSADAADLRAVSSVDGIPACEIHAIAPAGASLRIAAGETEPRLRGWAPGGGDISRCHPTPTCIYTFGGKAAVLATYVIVPIAPGDPSPVESVSALPTDPAGIPASAGTIELRDGRTILFVQRVPGAHRIRIGEHETDTEACALVLDSAKRIQAIHLAKGVGIWAGNRVLSPGDTL
jgi:hypothetical protein